MEQVFNRIKNLKKQYPNSINLYPGIDIETISKTEKMLNLELDIQLKEFYSFSNGFGIIDYCLLGINNKNIGGLFETNYLSQDKSIIEFLGTSGDEKFGYHVNQDTENHVVFYDQYDIYGQYERLNIAYSLKDFMQLFLDKIEVMLKYFDEKDCVIYFDDPKLPKGVNEWKTID